MKTSFKTRVSWMGLGSFVDINIFCYEIFFCLTSSYSPFFSNLLNQHLKNVKTPKRKLESFVQRYSFKFRALDNVEFCVHQYSMKAENIEFCVHHDSMKAENVEFCVHTYSMKWVYAEYCVCIHSIWKVSYSWILRKPLLVFSIRFYLLSTFFC